MSQEVLLTIENNVATLTLNRPHKGNALTATMNTQLLAFLDQIKQDPQVRVVVLTGAGKYFCTGMDLSMAATSSDEKDQEAAFANGIKVYEALYRYPKPVIARINGPCLGGGVGLIFTTDIRVAHKDAYFALTEVKRGILPAIISQYIVPELGSQKAKEYMLTGRKVSMEEVKSALSTVVSSEQELDQRVSDYATMLLESAPGAMAGIKQLVRVIAEGNDVQRSPRVQAYVKKAFLDMMKSEEAAYGIMSFMNKKKPDWSSLSKLWL